MSEDRRFTDPCRNDIAAIRESQIRTEAQIVSFIDKLESHHRTLYGSNGQPGLTIKVDRLEELEKSRTFHRGVIYTAVAGLGLDRIFSWIKGH